MLSAIAICNNHHALLIATVNDPRCIELLPEECDFDVEDQRTASIIT